MITDFTRGQGDKIDLRTIDANNHLLGNQAFDFIDTSAFTGVAGEARYQYSNGKTIILADIDGNRIADFSIELSKQIALLEQDFLL